MVSNVGCFVATARERLFFLNTVSLLDVSYLKRCATNFLVFFLYITFCCIYRYPASLNLEKDFLNLINNTHML